MTGSVHEPGHPLPGGGLILIRAATQFEFAIEPVEQFRIAEIRDHLALMFEFRELMFEFHKAAFVDFRAARTTAKWAFFTDG